MDYTESFWNTGTSISQVTVPLNTLIPLNMIQNFETRKAGDLSPEIVAAITSYLKPDNTALPEQCSGDFT